MTPGGRAWFGTGGPGGARVFRSEDGGRTWSVTRTPIRHDRPAAGIFSITFADERRGVAVGGDYEKPSETSDNIAVTIDGGKTWTAPAGPGPNGYRSAVAFVPGNRLAVIATGPNGTDIFTDGGDHWSRAGAAGYHALSLSARGGGWAGGTERRYRALFGDFAVARPDRCA